MAMGVLLKECSSKVGVDLKCDPALRNQRLTLLLRSVEASKLRAVLKELLDASPDATVNWESASGAWELTESLNRKKLVARLKDQDLIAFIDFLREEEKWLKETAPKELEQALRESDPRIAAGINCRRAMAALFTGLSEADLMSFLRGVPLKVKVGKAPLALRPGLRTYLRSAGHLMNADDAALDEHVLVFVFGRSPTDPLGARVFESRIDPDRGLWQRRTTASLRIPHLLPISALQEVFQLPPIDAKDNSPRVTLNVSPKEGVRDGAPVLQTFDQALMAFADGTGLDLVADGYVRAPTRFPANLRAENYPSGQLLDEYCRIWGCQWRYAKSSPNTIIIRAKGWWMEDAANVPDEQLKPLIAELASGKTPSLESLSRFAELDEVQGHKLIESGIVPGANGVLKPFWYDSLGAKPCLQLFNRLTAQQRDRVLSADGLPLREVQPELVHHWLSATLTAVVGIDTLDAVRTMVFRLSRLNAAEPLPTGFQVELSIPGGRRWAMAIRPPARRPSPPVHPDSDGK